MNTGKTSNIVGVRIDELTFHNDRRGWLAELFRFDEIGHFPVMAYISETLPDTSRGPHEHHHQTDMFVFLGPGDMQLCLWDNRPKSKTFCNKIDIRIGGSKPCRVLVPPGVVHGYRNISAHRSLVFNAPDKLFAGRNRSVEIDEIRHEDNPDTPYRFDVALHD